MRIFIITVALFSTLVISTRAQVKTLSSVVATKEHAESLAAQFVEGQYKPLFQEVRKYWPFEMSEIDTLESQTQSGTTYAAQRFGKILEGELLSTKTLGAALVRYTFAIRMEKHAVRLRITYYKGKTGWYINSFKWDDSVDGLFNDY